MISLPEHRCHDLSEQELGRTYETAITDETPELAAPIYRIPFPQDKLELVRWWIRGIVLTSFKYCVYTQIVQYEV